jgi:hypothetical protein
VRHVACMEKLRITYKILVCKSQLKRPVGKHKYHVSEGCKIVKHTFGEYTFPISF